MDQMQTALVTGGASGIGWAICQSLAAKGYRLVIADIDAQRAESRAALLGSGHRALAVDLTNPDAAGALLERAGDLGLVVNNAGMTDTGGHALCAMPDAAFERIVALNLTAVARICEVALATLAPGGVVINIASGAAWRPLALRGPYSATKAAVVTLTETMGPDYAARGLRIGAVAPGYTLTPLVEDLAAAGRIDLKAVAAAIPLGRLAMPEDIAQAVTFMASAEGAALGGRVLAVDGGVNQGQAALHGAPQPGAAKGQGLVAWLGEGAAKGVHPLHALGDLAAMTPLAGLVDATALTDAPQVARVLAQARDVARACATHPARTRDFALTFVAAADTTTHARLVQSAQAMLARTLALEWASAGLRVNAVAWHGPHSPHLATLCGFLSGPEGGYITGQNIAAGQPILPLT